MQEKLRQNKPLLLVIAITVFFMAVLALAVSAGRSTPSAQSAATPEVQTAPGNVAADATATPEPTATPAATPIPPFEITGLAEMTDVQRNSINMLNHLVVLTQEIHAHRNNRVYLEQAFMDLLNNTAQDAVDKSAQSRVTYMMQTLEDYRMIAIKRERLQFVYEQNQAQALRDAIPSTGSVMNAILSFNPSKIVGSIVYMAVDSVNSYTSSSSAADMQFIQSGWELDDAADDALYADYEQSWTYSTETVREYALDGRFALSHEDVNRFNEWKNASNNLQRIQFFEDNRSTYEFYGPYWLVLAECYYTNGDYFKCLQAIATYESLNIRIFRRDYTLAAVLPLAIAAANEVMSDDLYVPTAAYYAQMIMANTEESDWALRYVAARTFADLYARTGNTSYLETAYSIARRNVNSLIGEQRRLNHAYLANVQLTTPSPNADKADKAEITEYNNLIKATRKTELPPMYEPLMLNLDLLLAIADVLQIDPAERQRMDGILFENGEPLFLVAPINTYYQLTLANVTDNLSDITPDANQIVLRDSVLTIPAQYVSENAVIRMTVVTEDKTLVFTDWQVKNVNRATTGDISSFVATYRSPTLDTYVFPDGAIITVEVISHKGYEQCSVTCQFVAKRSDILFIHSTEVERVIE